MNHKHIHKGSSPQVKRNKGHSREEGGGGVADSQDCEVTDPQGRGIAGVLTAIKNKVDFLVKVCKTNHPTPI